MAFQAIEDSIMIYLQEDRAESGDKIAAILSTYKLNNAQIAEIIISAFKAGKASGKHQLKKQIARL